MSYWGDAWAVFASVTCTIETFLYIAFRSSTSQMDLDITLFGYSEFVKVCIEMFSCISI